MMGFTVKFTSGMVETFETSDAAKASVRRLYPEAKIGHDGDLTEWGDRTLCWKTETDSVNDDGRKSVAVITVS